MPCYYWHRFVPLVVHQSHKLIGLAVPWERLNRNDSMLLILDLQVGLYQLVRDFDATLYRDNMIAHSALGKLFNIPVVMSTSAQQGLSIVVISQPLKLWLTYSIGPNGPLPAEILKMYPNMPLIKRQGEVNAWDNPEFRAAIRATGKKQIIVAGIVTDVCMLSALRPFNSML
jgi:nicotinamidase-related amidase